MRQGSLDLQENQCMALPGIMAKPPGAWNPAILSGDRFRRRFALRLAGFFEQFALSAGPVLERISGRVTALQIDMVSAQRDLFRCGRDRGGLRLSHHWQGAVLRLGHTLLLPTAASILHAVESNSMRNHWRANRKIQYFKSKKQTPLKRDAPHATSSGAQFPKLTTN